VPNRNGPVGDADADAEGVVEPVAEVVPEEVGVLVVVLLD